MNNVPDYNYRVIKNASGNTFIRHFPFRNWHKEDRKTFSPVTELCSLLLYTAAALFLFTSVTRASSREHLYFYTQLRNFMSAEEMALLCYFFINKTSINIKLNKITNFTNKALIIFTFVRNRPIVSLDKEEYFWTSKFSVKNDRKI
jgi:hypothetical protein